MIVAAVAAIIYIQPYVLSYLCNEEYTSSILVLRVYFVYNSSEVSVNSDALFEAQRCEL